MFRTFRLIAGALLLAIVASCGPSKIKTYNGPPVTQIVVNKNARQMLFFSGPSIIAAYDVGLGTEPVGHKQFSGDGKTPEGLYYIDRRNPDSRYHLSIGISYPNPVDSAYAAALGQQAGGDIFIHGRGPLVQNPPRDWTRGCAAVTDQEMAEIFELVAPGTPIFIKP